MATARTTPLSMQAYGASLRALAAASPGRADRVLARRFLTPRRRRTLPPDIPGMPATRELVRHGRESLAAWRWGTGPDVLLAHGWESSAATWAPLVPPLVAAGYRVTAFDMPAHGTSTGRRTSVLDMAAALRTVAGTLGRLRAIVGHSAGGTAAAFALGDGLEADRAVLLAPAVRPALHVLDVAAALGLPAERGLGALSALEEALGVDPDRMDAARAVRDVRVPGLVIHDREDRRVELREGWELAEAWPGCRFLATRGLGHRLIADQGIVDTVVAFVGPPRRAVA